jgi:hypothetical protein
LFLGNWVNAQVRIDKYTPDNDIELKKLYQVEPERKPEPPENINLFSMGNSQIQPTRVWTQIGGK